MFKSLKSLCVKFINNNKKSEEKSSSSGARTINNFVYFLFPLDNFRAEKNQASQKKRDAF